MSAYTKKLMLFSIIAVLLAYPIAWAASNLYNAAYAPAEWYQQPSAFFRSLTNPPQIIPVMASDGYRMPVDVASLSAEMVQLINIMQATPAVSVASGMQVTIGSASFTTAPPFANASGATGNALIDSSNRLMVNVGSDSINLLGYIASVTKALQATPTFNIASGAFSGTVTVSTGSVSLNDRPASYTIGSGSIAVTNTVTATGTMAITGLVTATGTVIVSSCTAAISNIPASFTVGSGSIAITNTVTATGTVAITGTPNVNVATISGVVPVLTDTNVGFLNQPSGPFGVGYASATTLTWPSNAKGISVNSFNGVTLAGFSSLLKTGTTYVGMPIASGSYWNWTGNSSSTPSISFMSNNGTNNTIITVSWW